MRTRLLRPEILTDEVVGGMPDALALFYIKMWLLTDDEGYFELRPRQIAATLYPYRADRQRLEQTVTWLSRLVALGRVTMLPCGAHGVIPTIPKYRIKGGNHAATFKTEHVSCPVRMRPDEYARGPSTDESRTSTYEYPSDSESGTDTDSVSDSDSFSPPPAKLGRRENGTNPRAQGTNPRALGESPRQKLAAEKRAGYPDGLKQRLAAATVDDL